MSETIYLQHLEWQALMVLFHQKDRAFSQLRFVGFKKTVDSLMKHQPALAVWIGKPSDNQVHITDAGIALYMGNVGTK